MNPSQPITVARRRHNSWLSHSVFSALLLMLVLLAVRPASAGSWVITYAYNGNTSYSANTYYWDVDEWGP